MGMRGDSFMSARLGRFIYGLISGIAAVAASVAIALIGLEVGLRVWNSKPIVPSVNFVDLEVNAIVNPNNPLAKFDDRLGWAQVANRVWPDGGRPPLYTFGEDGI